MPIENSAAVAHIVGDINPTQIHGTGEATGFIPAPGDKGKPISAIGANFASRGD